jgi:hypothetical protein
MFEIAGQFELITFIGFVNSDHDHVTQNHASVAENVFNKCIKAKICHVCLISKLDTLLPTENVEGGEKHVAYYLLPTKALRQMKINQFYIPFIFF